MLVLRDPTRGLGVLASLKKGLYLTDIHFPIYGSMLALWHQKTAVGSCYNNFYYGNSL